MIHNKPEYTYFAEFRAIMKKLNYLDFESDKDCDAVGEIEDELNQWGCKAFDNHVWVYDMCGMWQHQYCAYCDSSKYPSMRGKTCGQLNKEMGNISEADYLAKLNLEKR